jgi:hypothetical protein
MTATATAAQIALVVADQREGMTDAEIAAYTTPEILAYVRNTIDLADVHGDDEVAEAYRAVLADAETLAVAEETDRDGDKLTATRLSNGTVRVVVATDGGDTFCSVNLSTAQWAVVVAGIGR